jgi:hypothetical protein
MSDDSAKYEEWTLGEPHKSIEVFYAEKANNYRAAALVAYGALLAANTDNKFESVLTFLEETLFPNTK